MTKYYCNACPSSKTCYHECDNHGVHPVNCLYDKIHKPYWRIVKKAPISIREGLKKVIELPKEVEDFFEDLTSFMDTKEKQPVIDEDLEHAASLIMAKLGFTERPRKTAEKLHKMTLKERVEFQAHLINTQSEPELMTFCEASKIAEKGEIIKGTFPPSNYSIKIRAGGIERFNISWDECNAKKWQIIPTEPKVLSPDEYAGIEFQKYFKTIDSAGPWFKKIANEMHEKGCEEQWLNHKELREVIGLTIKHCSDNDSIIHGKLGRKLSQAFNNLKPLKAE